MKTIIALFAAVCLYLVFINNPDWYFKQKNIYGRFTASFSSKSDIKTDLIFNSLETSLKKSRDWNDDFKFNFYFTSTETEFLFFVPWCSGKRYCLNPVADAVFISPVYAEGDRLKFSGDDSFYDPFYEIQKAGVQSFMLKLDSALGYIMTKDWIRTGYAEYMVGETPRYVNKDLCAPPSEPAYREFENRMCFKYLMEDMRLPIHEIVNGNYAYSPLLKETQIRYCDK